MQHRLVHLPGHPGGIDQRQRSFHRFRNRRFSILGGQQRRVGLPRLESRGPGNLFDLGGGIGGELGRDDLLAIGGPVQLRPQFIDTAAVGRRNHRHFGPVDPVCGQPTPKVVDKHLSLPGIESIGFVEDESHPGGVGCQARADIRGAVRRRTSRDRPPRPRRRCGARGHRPSPGARSGRCRRRAGRGSPRRTRSSRSWPTTRSTPSQSSRGRSSSRASLATHASGCSVVGRNARAGLTDVPASALSTDDFPTPVPPARASTYTSPGNPSRRSIRSTNSRADRAWSAMPRSVAATAASCRL